MRLTAAGPRQSIPLLPADAYLLMLDAMMRRGGQGGHVSRTVIELDGPPDRVALQRGWSAFWRASPLAGATLRRGFARRPVWAAGGAESQPPPIRRLDADAWPAPCAPSPAVDDAHGFPLRLDVCGHAVVLAWSHLWVDGKGAERLLAAVGAEAGGGCPPPPPASAPASPTPRPGPVERFRRTRAFVDHFYELGAERFTSPAGGRIAAGAAHGRVIRLGGADSAETASRASAACGPLLRAPFFVAAAAVATAGLLAGRGLSPGPQVIALPVQKPRVGSANGSSPSLWADPIFGNHVGVLFFRFVEEGLASVEEAAARATAQMRSMLADGLDESAAGMMSLMRRVPLRLHEHAVRGPFRGELATLFHSHTGPFANGLRCFAGRDVVHAYHVPKVSSPPGWGLFAGEHGGRITLTASWREPAVSEAEAVKALDAFAGSLAGEDAAGRAEVCLAF